MEGGGGASVQGVRDGIENESIGLIGIGIGSADISIGRTGTENIEVTEATDTDRDQDREIESLTETETESASVSTAGDAHGQGARSGAIETDTVDVTTIVLADQMMILTVVDTKLFRCTCIGLALSSWDDTIYTTSSSFLLSTLSRFYTRLRLCSL
jgi:hypothetical protein